MNDLSLDSRAAMFPSLKKIHSKDSSKLVPTTNTTTTSDNINDENKTSQQNDPLTEGSSSEVIDVKVRMEAERKIVIRERGLTKGRIDGLDRIPKIDLINSSNKLPVSNLSNERLSYSQELSQNIQSRMDKGNKDIGLMLASGLTSEQVQILESTPNGIDVKSLLGDYLSIKYLDDSRRRDIVLDFHFYNYIFCKESGFNEIQTKVYMAIMSTVWTKDMIPPPNVIPTMETSYDNFVELVLKHAVENPPNSILIFKKDDVSKILDFSCVSYFQQFRIYQYLFTQASRTVIKQIEEESKKGKKGKSKSPKKKKK